MSQSASNDNSGLPGLPKSVFGQTNQRNAKRELVILLLSLIHIFTIADSCFEIIGTAIPFVRGATDDTSDQIVVGSTQSNGNPAYDKTFAGPGVRRPYTGVTGTLTKVQILGVQFPAFAELSSQHFDVVPNDQQAVTYACVGTLGTLDANNDGQAQLMRYWNYGFINAQPVPLSLIHISTTSISSW